jgi:hypothetical protein
VFFFLRKIVKRRHCFQKIAKIAFFFSFNCQIETGYKFLGASVAIGLPMGDSFNGQIIKHSPFSLGILAIPAKLHI